MWRNRVSRRAGLLHSAALTSVERLHLDAARQRLVVEITLEDPEFFTRRFNSGSLEYEPSDLKIEPFQCTPEGVNGTIREWQSESRRVALARLCDDRRANLANQLCLAVSLCLGKDLLQLISGGFDGDAVFRCVLAER